MNIDNSADLDLEIINKLTNKLLSNEEMQLIELGVLKDALKNLYKEVLKVELSSLKENNEDNFESYQQKIIPPYIEEKNNEKEQKDEIEEKVFLAEETIEEEEIPMEIIVQEDEVSCDEKIVFENESLENEIKKDDNQSDLFDIVFKEPKINEEPEVTPNENEENLEEDIVEGKTTFAETEQAIFEDAGAVFDEKIINEEEVFDDKAKTIAEKLSSVSNTIADTIAVENKNTIADKVSKEKISNIKLAIGINDKFYFINRLFDGDVNFYNETIEKFNNFSSLNDAKILLQLLINKYDWDFEDEAFKKFEDIIERRY